MRNKDLFLRKSGLIPNWGLVLLCLFALSCKQKKIPIAGKTAFQSALNAVYKDASTSPLKPKDLANFKGLEFFKVDSSYVVKAHFQRTPKATPFKMKTTTADRVNYVTYGVLTFRLKQQYFRLHIYQSQPSIYVAHQDKRLFLPFSDETNAGETYAGGRYLDLDIPKGDSLTIDFNKAYNPYCAYNDIYSCPLVPEENHLKTRIEAGVKSFKKQH